MTENTSTQPSASSTLLQKRATGAIDAWLIEYSPAHYFSLPLHSCHEIMESPETVSLPGIARYGVGLLHWREQWVPLIDLESLINGGKANIEDKPHTLVISYKNVNAATEYVALALPAYPHLTKVTNDMLCALPTTGFDWSKYALSCFRYENFRVPIVDAQKLFSQAHL